jgi:replication initiation and membrane attachment protein DnaB
LEDDFQYLQVEHPEYTGDYILNIMVNMYLKSHLGELYYEELNLFMDEFIDKWLSENYGV